MMVIKYSKKF